ncbi:TPR domain-containing glycosyltransferase [Paenibacillus tepidiphilus]|uniref:TPR domain-containing glycosyltransferase n=1 Tax=Paenibacillus tepidiphilus TaxID=2608683 RepID=UPI001EF0DAA3|nr:TPR domain-containing glycosyltransferase [Paenibacillus tepidiphilus]
MPTLGVHLIVKDEADLLPQCLDSVAGADEIVVVDTGSTDNSITVAEQYGATVLSREWADDFSKARNAGLAQAGTDWILVLDADEQLQTTVADIRALLHSTAATAFTVIIDSQVGARAEERVTHRSVRLFRNGMGYCYNGVIHEGVDASIIEHSGLQSIADSNIQLIHFGYLPGLMAAKNKIKRNEGLLRGALANDPGDVFSRYNLAVVCCQDGRLSEAEELLVQALGQAPTHASFRPSIIRDLCTLYLSTGKRQRIDSLLMRELERYPDYADLHLLQGQSWEQQGHLERAFQHYQQAQALSDSPAPHGKYVGEAGSATYRPLCYMAGIAAKMGKWEEAARLYYRAIQYHPLYSSALTGISEAFGRLDVPEQDIAALLMTLVPQDVPAGRAAIVSALYETGAYETINRLDKLRFPLEPETALTFIFAQLSAGHAQEASGLLEDSMNLLFTELEKKDLPRDLWLLQSICHWELAGISDSGVVPDRMDWLRNDVWRLERKIGPGSSITGGVAAELIRLSVKLRRYPLASALAEAFPATAEELAAAFYAEGRLAEAGELFIELAEAGEVRGTTAFYLGEMLYDKGHYSQAAEYFHQAVDMETGEDSARIGLSLCYLHQAKQELEQALQSEQDPPAHSPLREDLAGIINTIALLNHISWHTEWSGHQIRGGSQP